MTTLAHASRQHTTSVTAGKPFFAEMINTLWLWGERSARRRQLKELTQRQLNDIGVSREAAVQEAAKPFWRA